MLPTEETRKQLFLRAIRGEPVEHVPVWIMRQAGRYLPEYRAVREQHSFLEMCKTPELAADVSLQPLRILGVDAVIVFSDILIAAEAMGMRLEIRDAGPILENPIRDMRGVEGLREFDPESDTRFVGDTIRLLVRAVGLEVPIIGFAAAPFTLACYMIEGKAGGELITVRRLMYSEPRVFRALLEKIAKATARYLNAQIIAGASAVQLFDTWAGELSRSDYELFELPATQQLLGELHSGSTPVILYAKGASHLVSSLARTGANALSVDWRTDLAEARQTLGPKIALQGNVDPAMLLGPEQVIRDAARAAIDRTGGLGHILNLGHGILPTTPVGNARAFVEAGQTAPVAARAAREGAD